MKKSTRHLSARHGGPCSVAPGLSSLFRPAVIKDKHLCNSKFQRNVALGWWNATQSMKGVENCPGFMCGRFSTLIVFVVGWKTKFSYYNFGQTKVKRAKMAAHKKFYRFKVLWAITLQKLIKHRKQIDGGKGVVSHFLNIYIYIILFVQRSVPQVYSFFPTTAACVQMALRYKSLHCVRPSCV